MDTDGTHGGDRGSYGGSPDVGGRRSPHPPASRPAAHAAATGHGPATAWVRAGECRRRDHKSRSDSLRRLAERPAT